jgi:hypothetical protein
MRQAAADVGRYTAPHVVSTEMIELTLFDLELFDLPTRCSSASAAGTWTE